MKKWNMIRWILGIPVIVLTLILVILICEPEKSGITRAAAAKSVALALLSPEELNAWEKTYGASRFAADEVGEWYVPYLDYLYENDYLDEAETPADREHAEGFLTYREAARIAEQLSGNLKRLVLANRRNGEKAYPMRKPCVYTELRKTFRAVRHGLRTPAWVLSHSMVCHWIPM